MSRELSAPLTIATVLALLGSPSTCIDLRVNWSPEQLVLGIPGQRSPSCKNPMGVTAGRRVFIGRQVLIEGLAGVIRKAHTA